MENMEKEFRDGFLSSYRMPTSLSLFLNFSHNLFGHLLLIIFAARERERERERETDTGRETDKNNG